MSGFSNSPGKKYRSGSSATISRIRAIARSMSVPAPGVSTRSAPYALIIVLRSELMPSGITMTHRYPLIAATAEQAIPALPVVHSMIVIPGLSAPRSSALVSMWA